MFAYLASHNHRDTSDCTAAVAQLAEQHGISTSELHQLVLPNFQLDFFDSGNELHHYKDHRYLLLLTGTILNKEAIQENLKISTDNDAKLVFNLYQSGLQKLKLIDGHLSFLLFDAQEQSMTLMSDRFHRYSDVYSASAASYVSSRSSLLYPFLDDKSINMDALSQSVRFRWLTGERRLFAGIHQVIPGTLTHIDKRGNTRREAYFRVIFARQTNPDLDHWVDEVDVAFDRSLALIANKHDVIGVPLSGGVDSSLLLAKAKAHFKDCVAVTARFLNGENPELQNARYFAKELGVRHIVVDIDDNDIRDFFPRVVHLHEQPPRNYSDIAFAKTLERLSTEADAFLYGEAADTLFGLNSVHRIVEAEKRATLFRRLPNILQRLAARLVPDRPGGLRYLKRALSHGEDALVCGLEDITYATPAQRVFACSKTSHTDPALDEYLSHQNLPVCDRAALQALSTGVMNHIENTGRLASYFGLTMYVPFVLNDLRSVAERLPFELQNDNGMLKTVLRELACRYFSRESIYSKKYGFPTPTTNWLNGPLRDRVARSRSGNGQASQYYSAEALSSLSVEKDFELYWFAICLDEILRQIET